MAYDDRRELLAEIERLRPGRHAIAFFNFDREVDGNVQGLTTQFDHRTKEALFRVLKEAGRGIQVDLILYTRGGDTNAVWPTVSILREFDPNFEVLVPFRCHSAGTLVALGARRIVMGPLAELSPIDPSTGNQFNPPDPNKGSQGARLGISVEDVDQFRAFVLKQLGLDLPQLSSEQLSIAAPFFHRLIEEVHPLALGNVHRVSLQIAQLAKKLLSLHQMEEDADAIVRALTTEFYSHLHMYSREEAAGILGSRVEAASDELSEALDQLLRAYEDTFVLRLPFNPRRELGDGLSKEVRFAGGTIESRQIGYLHETKAVLSQQTNLPSNVQIQIPPGQSMPLIPGLPRAYTVEVMSRGWVRNKQPLGVTV